MQRKSLALIVLLACSPAQAAIYKYVDANGDILFTDKYRPGAVKVMDTEKTPAAVRTPRAKKTSPASFPKVDKTTQRERDDLRRTLLLDERRKEEQALAAVKSALDAPGKHSQSELDKLIERIERHQKNIELLDRELEHLK